MLVNILVIKGDLLGARQSSGVKLLPGLPSDDTLGVGER